MITYEIVPRVGVGPVKFGMTRDEVRRVMRTPHESFRKGDAEVDAFHGGFHVFFSDKSNRVEFIELCRGFDFIASYHGTKVFSTPADEMVALVSREAAFDPDDEELGYTYQFPTLDLALWRPMLPGLSDGDEGLVFSTIAVGVEGYFASTS